MVMLVHWLAKLFTYATTTTTSCGFFIVARPLSCYLLISNYYDPMISGSKISVTPMIPGYMVPMIIMIPGCVIPMVPATHVSMIRINIVTAGFYDAYHPCDFQF